MVKLGNFFFHYRNYLFPIFYLTLFFPSPVIFEQYSQALIIGIIIAFSGQLTRIATIGLKYIIRGGKDRRVYAEDLITEGLFSHCRNPLYVGNILMLLGQAFIANNLYFLIIMFPLFVFMYQAIVRAEENFLQNKFGAAFDDYKKDVNRWMINPKGLSATLSQMTFKWKRVVLKEYNTTYIWLMGTLLIIGYKTGMILDLQEFMPLLISIGIITFLYVLIKVQKKTNRWVED